MAIFALILWLTLKSGLAVRTELLATADCTCSGHNVTYECTVTGGRFTVWSGSIMESNCEIALPHIRFLSSLEYCNNRAVVGQGISEGNNCFTSLLTIIRASSGLEGRSIICSVDYVSNVTLINTTNLQFTSVPFMPPSDVRLTNAKPGELKFSWMPPSQYCPSLAYYISADSCGTCPNMSASTNITCSNFTQSTVCTMSVYSIICDDLMSTYGSDVVVVNLRVPEIPTIFENIPYYSDNNNDLLRIMTTFRTVDSFIISNGIDGSAISYTLTYSDSTSNSICNSTIIPASSCGSGICSHVFNISSSNCPPSTDITVNLFATNILGDGKITNDITTGATNILVDVTFIPNTRSIMCTFMNQPQDVVKQCSISITYGTLCDQFLGVYRSAGPSDILPSPSIEFLDDVAEYCFTVNASSGNLTIVIEGNLNLITSSEGGTNVVAIVILSILSAIGIVGVSTISVVVAIKRYKHKPPPPVTVRFSNKHELGSLAKMLKVFKDHNINILRINTPWLLNDLKKSFRAKYKDNYVHFYCTNKQKQSLLANPMLGIQFLDDDPGHIMHHEGDNVSDETDSRPTNAIFSVKDKPGALWEALKVFEEYKINILGLNTHSKRETTPNYKDDYVSCLCSEEEIKRVVTDLKMAGAMYVTTEFSDPVRRNLQFYVKHERGALLYALKVFGNLNIDINGINYFSPPENGQQKQHVECICKKEERPALYHQLRICGAINVQAFEGISKSNDSETEPDYCVVEFSITDEIGSLAAALEGFHGLGVNIIGVNTLNIDPQSLGTWKTVEYLKMKIEFNSLTSDNESKLIEDLKATGCVIEPHLFKPTESQDTETNVHSGPTKSTVQFAIRHEAGTLIEALKVFAKFKVNITGIHDLRQGQSLEPESIKVEYKRNYVTFQCTSEQEGKLIAKLRTTGLAVNIEPFLLSDIHTTGTTENRSSYYNEGYPTNVALELSTVDINHKVALSDKTVPSENNCEIESDA